MEARQEQARREVLAVLLSKLHEPVLKRLKLGENIEKETRILAKLKHGSALARQRKRLATTLREWDLDEVEPIITAAAERQKGR